MYHVTDISLIQRPHGSLWINLSPRFCSNEEPHDLIYFLLIAVKLGGTPWTYDRGIAGAKGTGNKQNHGILQSS